MFSPASNDMLFSDASFLPLTFPLIIYIDRFFLFTHSYLLTFLFLASFHCSFSSRVAEPENLKTVPFPTFYLITAPVPVLAPVPVPAPVPGHIHTYTRT